MAENDRPHIKVNETTPPEDRIYNAGGGGGTFPRSEYSRHSRKIFREAQSLHAFFQERSEKQGTNKRYYKVELPDEKNVLGSDGKKLADDALGTLVGSPKKNIAHISTSQESFSSFVEQLKRYHESQTKKRALA